MEGEARALRDRREQDDERQRDDDATTASAGRRGSTTNSSAEGSSQQLDRSLQDDGSSSRNGSSSRPNDRSAAAQPERQRHSRDGPSVPYTRQTDAARTVTLRAAASRSSGAWSWSAGPRGADGGVHHRLVRYPLVQALDDHRGAAGRPLQLREADDDAEADEEHEDEHRCSTQPLQRAEHRSARRPRSCVSSGPEPGSSRRARRSRRACRTSSMATRSALWGAGRPSRQTQARAAAQLLGAQRGDVDEQETAVNRRRRLGRNLRALSTGCLGTSGVFSMSVLERSTRRWQRQEGQEGQEPARCPSLPSAPCPPVTRRRRP